MKKGIIIGGIVASAVAIGFGAKKFGKKIVEVAKKPFNKKKAEEEVVVETTPVEEESK